MTELQCPRIELNGSAPDFEANTTHGIIKFSEWGAGKWVILFSHPADFTPVCTSELIALANRAPEFEKRGVLLIGNSIDSNFSHIAWIRNIEEKFEVKITFPIIADLDQKVSRLYGMVHDPTAMTAAVRCVFFIDPKMTVRAMIYYPLNVGRNFDEIVRVIDALQTADRHGVACPADWKRGEPVIVPPPMTVMEAESRMSEANLQVTDWYFSKKEV